MDRHMAVGQNRLGTGKPTLQPECSLGYQGHGCFIFSGAVVCSFANTLTVLCCLSRSWSLTQVRCVEDVAEMLSRWCDVDRMFGESPLVAFS